VRVQDRNTLLVPDRRGNNRVDSLRNLIADPRLSLLFLIPGCGETLRVIGRAVISIDPALLHGLSVEGKAPRSVLVMTVERVFYQCASAINRAKLWDSSRHVDRKELPSTNAILAAIQWGNVRQALRLRGGAAATGCEVPGDGTQAAPRTSRRPEEITHTPPLAALEPL